MLIGTNYLSTVPTHHIKQMRSLTFRWKSPMKVAFSNMCRGVWAGKIVYKLDESREKVLAWGLFVWKPDESQPEIMLYTRQSERGKGHAKEVFWALRHSVHPECAYVYYPHDKGSHDFYIKRFNERVSGKMPHPECLWIRQ